LADVSACKIIQIEAVEDSNELSHFKFQIKLSMQDWSDKLVIGLNDADNLMLWLNIISDAVSISPPATRPQIPTFIVQADSLKKSLSQNMTRNSFGGVNSNNYAYDSPASFAVEGKEAGTSNKGVVLEGYLFKQSDTSRAQLINRQPAFHKRWFVLHDTELLYYKTILQAHNGERPSGNIQIRSVFNIREIDDPSAPENSIEIATTTRTYLMVAEDEEWQSRWLEALGDVIEAREEALAEIADDENGMKNKEEDLSKQIIHRGTLLRNSKNRITGLSSWKEFYFILTAGILI
jgi:hypothetical protein